MAVTVVVMMVMMIAVGMTHSTSESNGSLPVCQKIGRPSLEGGLQKRLLTPRTHSEQQVYDVKEYPCKSMVSHYDEGEIAKFGGLAIKFRGQLSKAFVRVSKDRESKGKGLCLPIYVTSVRF
jgi:hypothetical protein